MERNLTIPSKDDTSLIASHAIYRHPNPALISALVHVFTGRSIGLIAHTRCLITRYKWHRVIRTEYKEETDGSRFRSSQSMRLGRLPAFDTPQGSQAIAADNVLRSSHLAIIPRRESDNSFINPARRDRSM